MTRRAAPAWLLPLAATLAPIAAVLLITVPLRVDGRERRAWQAVDDARCCAGPLVALGVTLPKLRALESSHLAGTPRILASADGIAVDHADWLLALPDDTRRRLRGAWRERGRDLGALATPRHVAWPAEGYAIPGLGDALAHRRELRELLEGLGDPSGTATRVAGDLEEVDVLADGALPYRRIVQVVYTAFQAETSTVWLAVAVPDRRGFAALPVKPGAPGGCGAVPPPACDRVVVTVRGAPERLEVSVTPGPCITVPPPPCAPGPVEAGTCAVLPVTDDALQTLRATLDALPACSPLVVAAEPEVWWSTVARVGGALTSGSDRELGLGVTAGVP